MEIQLILSMSHIDGMVRGGWLREDERNSPSAVASAASRMICASSNDLGLAVRSNRLHGAGAVSGEPRDPFPPAPAKPGADTPDVAA